MRGSLFCRLLLLICSLAVADAVMCDISLIKGVTPEEIVLVPENENDNSSIKYLFCSKEGNSLKEMRFNTQPLSDANRRITCDMNRGWMDDGIKLAEADAPLTVGCREHCAATGPIRVEGKWGADHRIYPNYALAIVCSDSRYPQLVYKGQPVGRTNGHYEYCNATGWPYLPGHPDGSTPIHFECRAAPCWASISDIKDYKYDEATRTMTCFAVRDGNSLAAIEFNSKRYDSLKCNENNEWIGGNEKIADTSYPLNGTCVKYCESAGAGIQVEKDGANVVVSCSDPDSKLFHNDRPVWGQASCNLDGWLMKIYHHNERQGNALTPQQFECRKDPTATTTTTIAPRIITKRPRVKTTAAPLTAETEEDDGDYTILIMIGCSIGAFILGVVAAVTIAKVFCADNKRPEQGQTSRRSRDEGGRKRDRRGDDKNRDDADSVSTEV